MIFNKISFAIESTLHKRTNRFLDRISCSIYWRRRFNLLTEQFDSLATLSIRRKLTKEIDSRLENISTLSFIPFVKSTVDTISYLQYETRASQVITDRLHKKILFALSVSLLLQNIESNNNDVKWRRTPPLARSKTLPDLLYQDADGQFLPFNRGLALIVTEYWPQITEHEILQFTRFAGALSDISQDTKNSFNNRRCSHGVSATKVVGKLCELEPICNRAAYLWLPR